MEKRIEREDPPERRRVRERVSRLKESDSPVCQKCEIRLLSGREEPRREGERGRQLERDSGEAEREGGEFYLQREKVFGQ